MAQQKFASLRDFRSKRDLTLAEAGELLGVNKSTVLRWEKGLIPAERVGVVSELTGICKHGLRSDLFDPPETTGDAIADRAPLVDNSAPSDPAKADGAAASTSQSDGEHRPCPDQDRPRADQNRPQADRAGASPAP